MSIYGVRANSFCTDNNSVAVGMIGFGKGKNGGELHFPFPSACSKALPC